MAEDMGGDRTEKATPKRRQDARKEGQVAKSQEVNSAVVLLGGGMAAVLSTAWMGRHLREVGIFFFEGIDSVRLESPREAIQVMAAALQGVTLMLAPILLVTFLVSIMAAVSQVGWSFHLETLSIRFNKLNPVEGFKRFVSKQAFFELTKNLMKVGLLALVSWLAVRGMLPKIYDLMAQPTLTAWAEVVVLVRTLLLRMVGVLVVLAAADLIWQRYRFEESIKMTKQEIKQEAKDSDGDPQIRARIKSIMLEMARRRMMDDLKKADVVITNPTHYSVALKYDRTAPAPKVVAKGQGHLALRIRTAAAEAGVPLVENVPLAQALYKTAKVGDLVPTKLYEAVAQVLAAVYGNRRRRSAAGEA